MTEDEAKTKWCPFSNVYVPYHNIGAAGNRGSLLEGHQMPEKHIRCLGSGCMSWRWGDFVEVIDGKRVDHGFCGLAGKP